MTIALRQHGFLTADEVNTRIADVYRMMAGGFALSALLAFTVLQSPGAVAYLVESNLVLWLLGGQLLLVLAMSVGRFLDKLSSGVLRVLFYVLSASFGVTLSPVLAAYTGASVMQAFAISCAVFAAAAFYGYATKRSLAGLGSVLLVFLIGALIAGVVNLFLRNGLMQVVLDMVCVAVFAGFTAYDSQRVRDELMQSSGEKAERIVAMGALSLYLNMVNIFAHLLNLTGDRE